MHFLVELSMNSNVQYNANVILLVKRRLHGRCDIILPLARHSALVCWGALNSGQHKRLYLSWSTMQNLKQSGWSEVHLGRQWHHHFQVYEAFTSLIHKWSMFTSWETKPRVRFVNACTSDFTENRHWLTVESVKMQLTQTIQTFRRFTAARWWRWPLQGTVRHTTDSKRYRH
jgi:hypothetical protein